MTLPRAPGSNFLLFVLLARYYQVKIRLLVLHKFHLQQRKKERKRNPLSLINANFRTILIVCMVGVLQPNLVQRILLHDGNQIQLYSSQKV